MENRCTPALHVHPACSRPLRGGGFPPRTDCLSGFLPRHAASALLLPMASMEPDARFPDAPLPAAPGHKGGKRDIVLADADCLGQLSHREPPALAHAHLDQRRGGSLSGCRNAGRILSSSQCPNERECQPRFQPERRRIARWALPALFRSLRSPLRQQGIAQRDAGHVHASGRGTAFHQQPGRQRHPVLQPPAFHPLPMDTPAYSRRRFPDRIQF